MMVDPGSENLLSSARVAILGLGLMGGSLAMALRGRCALLLGCDPNPHTVQLALTDNVVDQASTQAAEILPLSDFVVLAAPIHAILFLLEKLDHLHPGKAVVLDLGSTKRQILAAMALLPERFDPIGGHPICGKEQSSLFYAEPGLYQAAPFVLCRLGRTTPRAVQLAAQLVGAIGAHPLWMEALDHDRWVASTSHLPYLIANALVQATPIDSAPLIGPGFRSTSRLAGSFAPMMLDVLETNCDSILSALQLFRSTLDQLEDCLQSGDVAELKEFLIASARKHAALLDRPSPGSVNREQAS